MHTTCLELLEVCSHFLLLFLLGLLGRNALERLLEQLLSLGSHLLGLRCLLLLPFLGGVLVHLLLDSFF